MDKRFLSILAGLVIIFGGIFVFSQKSNNTSNGSSSGSQATNHVLGAGTKNVTFVEYGDYQCPICGAYYQPLKQVQAKFGDEIKFQFRNLPLTSIHQNAFAAARAAEAAGIQNKYFEMHDKLYENQSAWSNSNKALSIFQGYAKDLGLNSTQFNSDYSSSKVNDAINADLAEFKKTGKDQSTPSLFLDGKYVDNTKLSDPATGAPSADKISKLIQDAIDSKTRQ